MDLLLDLDYEKGAGWEFFGWNDELRNIFKRKVDVVSSGGLRKDRFFTRFVEQQKVLIYARPD